MQGNMPLGLDDGPMSVAINDYQIDVGEFYAIAYACAKNHPDGDGKVSDDYLKLPTDGSKPECFYNVPVVEGAVTWNDDGYAYITDIGLNTAGVADEAPPPNFPDARGSLQEEGSWCWYNVGGGRKDATEACCVQDGVNGRWDDGMGRCFGLAHDGDKCGKFYGCCIDWGSNNQGSDPCH